MNYHQIRRKTKEITIGTKAIGGTTPIAIQSMTNTDTHDKEGTLAQIRALESAGCDIVRITVPDVEAADTIPFLKEAGVRIPIVADIHFDYRVALRCAEVGVDKIRINPGNIGDEDRVRAVCKICSEKNIPIRIGVNSGSLEKEILARHGAPTPEALLVAERCSYPLHLGVTEAGSREMGSIKSAVGIGSLLTDGIGDTIRVSLTDDPVQEIEAAKKILRAVGIEGQSGMDIVSCPTCGRTKIDLISLVAEFEKRAKAEGLMDLPLKVAIMGCVVNGPGEAREADIGIAGGKGEAVLIQKGEIIRKLPEREIVSCLIEEIKKFRK